ncbi:MAG TPA: glycosyltransferase family A protein [Pyrinomonadaceae bacterium]|jgi:glycosyltransferase involved in cell wall biosynthesis|nr:glycosyltransferase family A protein [Pyrinomonadaceae bacterium]
MQNGKHSNPETPLISIVIPAYNVSSYIGDALRSVFVQDFKNYEVIVVNDGSTDTPELEKVLEPYREKIVYINQENRGISAARNAALQVARGELIALLDSDDIWMEGKLSEQLTFMKQGFDMVYSDAVLIGDFPWPEGTTFMDRSPSNGPVTLHSLLDLQVTVVVSTVVMRKDLVVQVGGFDEGDRNIVEDFDLWLRLAHAGARIGYQRKVLAKYRYRSDSVSASRIKLHQAALRVLNKTRSSMSLSPVEKEALDRTQQRLESILMLERGKDLIVNGELAEARAIFSKARQTNSSWKIPVMLLALRMFPGLLRRYMLKHHHTQQI